MKILRIVLLAGLAWLAAGASPAWAQGATQVVQVCIPITNTSAGYTQYSCQPVSSGNPLPVSGSFSAGTPAPVPSTGISGTITTGGTFQTILAANLTTRKGCLVQNPTTATEPLYVYATTGGSPTLANSFSLAPGSSFGCAAPGGTIISDAIQVTATTTGHAFTGNSQ